MTHFSAVVKCCLWLDTEKYTLLCKGIFHWNFRTNFPEFSRIFLPRHKNVTHKNFWVTLVTTCQKFVKLCIVTIFTPSYVCLHCVKCLHKKIFVVGKWKMREIFVSRQENFRRAHHKILGKMDHFSAVVEGCMWLDIEKYPLFLGLFFGDISGQILSKFFRRGHKFCPNFVCNC